MVDAIKNFKVSLTMDTADVAKGTDAMARGAKNLTGEIQVLNTTYDKLGKTATVSFDIAAKQGKALLDITKQINNQIKALGFQRVKTSGITSSILPQDKAVTQDWHKQQGELLLLEHKRLTALLNEEHKRRGQLIMSQYLADAAREKEAHKRQGEIITSQYQTQAALDKEAHKRKGELLMAQYLGDSAKEKEAHKRLGEQIMQDYLKINSDEKAAHKRQGEILMSQYLAQSTVDKAAHKQTGELMMSQYLADNARIREAEQVRLSQFSQFLKQKEALLRSDIAAQRSIEISGIDSIESHRARANQQRLAAEQAYRNKIAMIESSVRGGTRSSIGETQATLAMNNYLAALKGVDTQLATHEKRLAAASVEHKNMFIRVLEVTASYRSLMTVWQLIKSAAGNIPTVGINLESSNAALTAITGNITMAHREMAFLRGEADRTGISLDSLRSSFRLFSASAVVSGESIQTVEKIFKSVNTMATTLHLSSDDVSGTFNALAQMYSKGKIQSEELVKQLSNRIPGAVGIMAKAYQALGKEQGRLNETQADATKRLLKDMKMGVVTAHDLLPQFAAEIEKVYGGAAFETASKGFNSSLGRLSSAWTDLSENVYVASSKTMIAILTFVTGSVDNLVKLTDNTDLVQNKLTSFGTFITTFVKTAMGAFAIFGTASLALKFAPIVAEFGLAITATATLSTAWAALNTVILASPVGVILALTAAVAGLTMAQQAAAEEQNAAADRINQRYADEAAASKPKTKEESFAFRVDQEDIVKQSKARLEQSMKVRDEYLNESTLLWGETSDTFRLLRAESKKGQELQKRVTADAMFYEKDRQQAAENLKLKESTIGITDQTNVKSEAKISLDSTTRALEEARARQLNTEELISIELEKQKAILSGMKKTDDGVEPSGMKAQTAKVNVLNSQLLEQKLKGVKEIEVLTKEFEIKNRAVAVSSATATPAKFRAAIRSVESSTSDPNRVSPAGAMGADQIMPRTYNGIRGGDEAMPHWMELAADEATKHYNNKGGRPLTSEEKAGMRAWSESHQEALKRASDSYMDLAFKAFPGDVEAALGSYNMGIKGMKEVKAGKRGLPAETKKYMKDTMAYMFSTEGETKAYLDSQSSQKSDRASLDITKAQGSIEVSRIIAANTARENEEANNKKLEAERKATQELKDKITLENESLALKSDSLKQSQLTSELQKIDLEFTKKQIEFRKAGNFAGIEYLKILRDQEKVQAVFLDAQRKAGQAAEYLGFAQEAINLKRATGEISELQALAEIQKAKEAQLPTLEDELSKVSAIADEEQRKLETLKLQAQIREIRYPNTGAAEKFMSGVRSEGLAGQIGQIQTDKNSRKAGLEQGLSSEVAAINNDPLINQETKLAKSAEVHQKYQDAKLASDTQYYGSLAGLASETFGGITSQMIKMYGVQSKQARLAFAAQKAASVAAVIMNTATAVMAQLSNPTPYVGIPLAAIAAGMGAIQLATVIAQPMPQAHGGADNIPQDATYLLSKGERVLSPNQNQEFMKLNRDNARYINRTSSTRGNGQSENSSQPTVVKPQIKVVNIDYSSQDFDKYLSSNSGEQVVVNHMTRNKESLA